MRTIIVITAGLVVFILAAGCLTISRQKFSLDTDTGIVMHEYLDLGSKKGDEKNYSAANDWTALKQAVEDNKPEFDTDVVEDISKVLFEENKTLCARRVQKVKCPKCFPSKTDLLIYVHDKDSRIETINEEIVLIMPASKNIISTNGQPVKTKSSSLIFWPKETTRFEYLVSDATTGGVSLLPYYLKEKNNCIGPHRDAALR